MTQVVCFGALSWNNMLFAIFGLWGFITQILVDK